MIHNARGLFLDRAVTIEVEVGHNVIHRGAVLPLLWCQNLRRPICLSLLKQMPQTMNHRCP